MRSSTADEIHERSARFTDFRFDRSALYFIICSAMLANGVYSHVVYYIATSNFWPALESTFGISAITWLGFWVAIGFLGKHNDDLPTRLDYFIAVFSVVVMLLPVGTATWPVITALALYLILTSQRGSPIYGAALIILSSTVPMFWGRHIMALFSDYILSVDAIFVSAITNTQRYGNLVRMPSGEGFLAIQTACSSLTNISLSMMCWVVLSQARGIVWRPLDVVWCFGACLAMVAINVVRIALIGFFPEYYVFIHSGFGSTIFAWTSMCACFGVCYLGTSRAA